MALNKVKPGDPLVIPAQTFNTFIDAAQDFQQRQRNIGRTPQREIRQTGIVLVRNESGANRDRFDVLGISAPIILPDANADEFKQRVALRGVLPADEHVGRFVVLIEPLPVNAIGQAWIDGICIARVNMLQEDHVFADAMLGDASSLESGATGSAQLLWIEPEGDRTGDNPFVVWAVVRIGSTGTAIARGERAHLTGYSNNEMWFKGYLIDNDNNHIGEEITIYAYKYPTAHEMELYAPFVIGELSDIVPVMQAPTPLGGGDIVYFVRGLFTLTCSP